MSRKAAGLSSPFFPLFFFFFSSLLPNSLSSPHPDVPPLLDFKSSADPAGALSSWDPAAGDPCSASWLGVSCSGARVTAIVLEGLALRGPVDALAHISTLSLLSLKNNSFSSPLHDTDFSSWRPHLKLLYLSANRFSGPFPPGFLALRHLRRLDLAGNLFSGRIPPEIGLLLPGLLTLRLESNRFSGAIPASLGDIPGLVDVDASHNRLAGPIPEALASFPPSAFAGNPDLCGDPLPRRCPNRTSPDLPAPPIPGTEKRKWKVVGFFTATVAAAAILIAAAVLFLIKRRLNRTKTTEVSRADTGIGGGREESTGEGKGEALVHFEGSRRIAMEDLMQGAAEFLGRGVVGSTYRVVIEGGDGEEVVVKRVRRNEGWRGKWFELEESLLREIGRWRHPNLVSLRAYSCDHEELLLVYDYLPGGSLHSLLHGLFPSPLGSYNPFDCQTHRHPLDQS